MFNLGQRQNARQDSASDAEFALAEVDRFVARRRALDGKVQALLRMALAGIVEQPDVGQDNRVHTLVDRSINGLVPVGDATGLSKGIDRQQHFAALGMGIANAFGHGLLIEVQAGKITCIGIVLEAEVNSIGAVINGCLECRQAASRANKVGQGAHGRILKVKPGSIVRLRV